MDSTFHDCDTATIDRVENLLSELFDQSVTASDVGQQSSSGSAATITFANMQYRIPDSDDYHKIKQSVVLFEADDLDLPKFRLTPKSKGILGAIMKQVAGEQGITFPDSPEFTESHNLLTWAEPACRILFTHEIRDYFAANKKWSVRASGKCLAIFSHKIKVSKSAQDAFIGKSLGIVRLFHAAEKELDARPEVSREASMSDTMQVAGRMGLVGAVVQKQLRKYAVTKDELAAFKNSPTPRPIPIGLQRQVVGWDLRLIGVPFILFGIVSMIVAAFIPDTIGKIVCGTFGFLFALGGAAAVYFLHNRRSQKLDSLKNGELVEGTVQDVTSSGIRVNNSELFRIKVTYPYGTDSEAGIVSVSGNAVSIARRFLDTKEPVRLLTGGKQPVCLDFVQMWD